MYVADSVARVHQIEPIAQILRQRFLYQRDIEIQRAEYDLAQVDLKNAFGERINRDHAPARERIGVFRVDFDLRGGHLHSPSSRLHGSVSHDLAAPQFQELLLTELLIEPRQHDGTAAIIHHDLSKRQPALGLLVIRSQHRASNGRRFSVLKARDPCEVRAVFIATWEVVEKVPCRFNVELT